MKLTPFKTTTVGLATTFGLFASLSAIERPGENKAKPLPERALPVLDDELPLSQETSQEKIAWLGVLTEALSDDLAWHLKLDSGVIVRVVDPNSPAAEAGLQERDIITSIDGLAVQSREQVKAAIRTRQPGEEVVLKIHRQGEGIDQKVTLGGREQLPVVPGQPGFLRNQPGFAQILPDGMPQADAERLHRELLKRVEEALKNPHLGLGRHKHLNLNDLLNGARAHGKDFNLGLKNTGSFMLHDDQGTVEMRTEDGKHHVKLADPDGNVLFEGPYTTPEDKAAVPEEYRERIKSLGIDGEGKNTFRFNFRVPSEKEKSQKKDE